MTAHGRRRSAMEVRLAGRFVCVKEIRQTCRCGLWMIAERTATSKHLDCWNRLTARRQFLGRLCYNTQGQ